MVSIFIIYKSKYISEGKNNNNIEHIKETSGSSPLLIASDPVNQDGSKATTKDSTRAEAHILASCAYENDTKWGKEVKINSLPGAVH